MAAALISSAHHLLKPANHNRNSLLTNFVTPKVSWKSVQESRCHEQLSRRFR
jgi:hypothetical protein